MPMRSQLNETLHQVRGLVAMPPNWCSARQDMSLLIREGLVTLSKRNACPVFWLDTRCTLESEEATPADTGSRNRSRCDVLQVLGCKAV